MPATLIESGHTKNKGRQKIPELQGSGVGVNKQCDDAIIRALVEVFIHFRNTAKEHLNPGRGGTATES